MDHCLFDSSDRRPTETCPLSCRWDMGLLTDGGGSRITYDGIYGTVPKNGLGRRATYGPYFPPKCIVHTYLRQPLKSSVSHDVEM